MKSINCLLILLTLTLPSFAQEQMCKVVYPQAMVKDASNSSEILYFINAHYKEEIGATTLTLKTKTESIGAYHYLFQQEYLSIPIHHADIKLNISKAGKIISVYSNLTDAKALTSTSFFPSNAIDDLYENWYAKNKSVKQVEKSYCYLLTTNGLIPAVKIKYTAENSIAYEVTINQSGLIQTYITSTFFAQDSLVTGKVFNPDPLTSAAITYGGTYQDFNDSDVVALNNQRQTKSFKADFDGTTFRLKNQFVELRDNNGDGFDPITSTSPVFDFTRHQNGFEDVNTFFHLSKHSDYIRSLGFNASSQLVYPDPHGGTADNSFFNEPNTIYFGTGGVDDAEDADVLIHEFTHFVSYNAAPLTNSGQERNSIDEGTCDYFAASYSKAISAYNWTKLFNWDGNPPFWNGRMVNTTKHYPENVSNNIYKDGEMWSATLMQIHDELGRATTDSIVLQTMYLFASNMTYPQAAQALLDADTLLTGGRNFCVLYKYLYQRGYLPLTSNACGINGIDNIKLNTIALVYTKNGYLLSSEDQNEKVFEFSIINLNGQTIFHDSGKEFNSNNILSTGIYFVGVQTNKGYKVFKYFAP